MKQGTGGDYNTTGTGVTGTGHHHHHGHGGEAAALGGAAGAGLGKKTVDCTMSLPIPRDFHKSCGNLQLCA